jgi:hypothetical protein
LISDRRLPALPEREPIPLLLLRCEQAAPILTERRTALKATPGQRSPAIPSEASNLCRVRSGVRLARIGVLSEMLNGIERIAFLYPQQIIWNKGRIVLTRTHYSYQHDPCWQVRKKNPPR